MLHGVSYQSVPHGMGDFGSGLWGFLSRQGKDTWKSICYTTNYRDSCCQNWKHAQWLTTYLCIIIHFWPWPLTPAHLIYDRRITSIPHLFENPDKNTDSTYLSDQDMRKATSKHSKIIQQFCVRWRKEYLTALWIPQKHRQQPAGNQEGRCCSGSRWHPTLHWKLAVVDDLVNRKDGLMCSTHISTANHKTTRPITRLYLLEVVSSGDRENTDHQQRPTSSDSEICSRSKRAATAKAMTRITKWTDTLQQAQEKCRE